MITPRFLPHGGRRPASALVGQPALELDGVSVRYRGARQPALEAVSLTVPAGSRVALVGPNGSGKSTILKAAAGLLPVVSGAIRQFGQPIGADRARVAYLPQRSEIDWHFPLDLQTLVMTGRYVHLGWLRRPSVADRRLVSEVLERLGLAALAGRQISELSGGQQQRGLLARALVQGADLLLLDEPFNAVDRETRGILANVLDELRQAGKTIVMATHEINRKGAGFDDVLYLDEGRAVERPSLEDVQRERLSVLAWAS